MTRLQWGAAVDRKFETGTDRGVLYHPNNLGLYESGTAWNGLTAVNLTPSGAESNKQYADNGPYLNLISAEEMGATIEALFYPNAFERYNGVYQPVPGFSIGQQDRPSFGFSFRTLVGDAVQGTSRGYKLHCLYACQAAPSEKNNQTVNDSPEATAFSWELTTTPVPVGTVNGNELKPTAYLSFDSTLLPASLMDDLVDILWGSASTEPRLPQPAELVTMFDLDLVAPDAPTFVSGTGVITIPSVTGVVYSIGGTPVTAGPQTALDPEETAVVTAAPDDGYYFAEGTVTTWSFTRDA